MDAWDIRKKVVTVSADGAYNIKKVRTFLLTRQEFEKT